MSTRRNFLRGAGGLMLALPFMESVPSFAAGTAPKRLLWWYTPNGHNMLDWTPSAEGGDYTMSPILQPFSAFRERMTVVSGLSNVGCYEGGGASGHNGSAGAFLTCAALNEEHTFNGISIDQVAAADLGALTPFPSLELGIDAGSAGNCGNNVCGYSSNISWSGAQTPRPKVVDPKALFQRLFHTGDLTLPPEEVARRQDLRLSVLDGIAGDLQRLSSRLPSRDRAKLDEHTTAVRELEVRIDSLASVSCEPGEAPGVPVDLPEHVDMMSELMAMAFECDLTRVISFMFGNAGSNLAYDWIGIAEWHHALSHHGGDKDKLAKLTRIGQWQSEAFVRFLNKLDGRTDVDGGNLLDSAVMLYGSGMSDGHYHRNDNLPLVLCGGGEAFRHGHHLVAKGQPLADLHLAMLAAVDVHVASHGYGSTGPLAGLT